MNKMELYTYYNLDECIDRAIIVKRLESYKDEGKVEYSFNGDILKLTDIDLEDRDIDKLIDLFDRYDVFGEIEDNDDFDEDESDEDYEY
jgi:hypothetical protein